MATVHPEMLSEDSVGRDGPCVLCIPVVEVGGEGRGGKRVCVFHESCYGPPPFFVIMCS